MTDDAAPGLVRPRLVLLGASNLTSCLSTVLSMARALVGSPMDVFAALGHGRSYGMNSSILGRGLPGILQCGLWEALRPECEAPTYALLTDVGNDIGYEVLPDRVASWVEQCLDRLASVEAQVVMTTLPLGSLESMSAFRYYVARTILFPSCRLSHLDGLARALSLDARLRELARRYGTAVVEPDARWYGLDPIHMRKRFREEAWRRVFEAWADRGAPGGAISTGRAWPGSRPRLYLRAERCWLFGRELRTVQPSLCLYDGTTVSLY